MKVGGVSRRAESVSGEPVCSVREGVRNYSLENILLPQLQVGEAVGSGLMRRKLLVETS